MSRKRLRDVSATYILSRRQVSETKFVREVSETSLYDLAETHLRPAPDVAETSSRLRRRLVDVGNVTLIPSDETEIRQYPMKEVALHSDRDSCWLVIKDFVYDVTSFLSEHPGGWEVIMERGGTDATYAFEGKGHSDDAVELLGKFKIGQLTKNDRLEKG
ncbi:cytochrome b5-like [Diadema antillarum]|uniref:cytochrome b5-like n=1 Tax=Diadema antillarum TaxID=105358 RepID=UPI003A85D848